MALDPNYIMDDGDDYRKNDMISLAFDIHEFFINKGFTYDEIKLDNVMCTRYKHFEYHDGMAIFGMAGSFRIANTILATDHGLHFTLMTPQPDMFELYLLEIQHIGTYDFYKSYHEMLTKKLDYIDYSSYISQYYI